MDYSWMVSLALAGVTFIGAIFVMRYMVTELKKTQESMVKRLDKHGDDIVSLNTRSKLAVTAKDVDEKYLSKELFRQFEKHMDTRFDSLEKGQGKILEYIKETK